MKVIIAGSRSIVDYGYVEEAIEASGFKVTKVVSGTANGVDRLGEDWAEENGVKVKPFPADWKNLEVKGAVIKENRYGKYNAVAGHQRNERMAKYAKGLIAVWDGKSKGTMDMIERMKAKGKKVFVYDISKV